MYTLYATLENNRITTVKQRQVEAVKHGDVIKLDDGQLARIFEQGDGRQRLCFIDPYDRGDDEQDPWADMLAAQEETEAYFLMSARGM